MKKQQTLATLPNIAAFCLTFEAGSFTKAAEQLSQTPQAVSRAVARLEESIGATLFRRTTRQLHPTDQGRSYYEACKQAMTTLSNAEALLQTRQQSPSGKVRVSLPTTYAQRLLPRMGEFRKKYPTIDVELNISN
jgi:DNA-binding transcriptional LysR family regulator